MTTTTTTRGPAARPTPSVRRQRRARSSYAAAALALCVCALPTPAAQAARAARPCDDGRVAFVADTGDGEGVEVYVVRADGTGLTRVTHLDGEAIAPDWSPDGRSIVFEEDLADEARGRIQVMDADGRHRYVLVEEPGAYDASPSFTPDGRHIVFIRFDPATERFAIWWMARDGSHRTRLTPDTATPVTAPHLSPDGRTLSYLPGDPGLDGMGLDTSRLDGSHVRELVPVSADLVDKQDWSPDGRRIASSAGHDHLTPGVSENLVTVPAKGGPLTYPTHFTGGDTNAVMGSYSPTGHEIAFRLEQDGQFGLYRIAATGGTPQPILPLSTLKPRYIDWGPAPRTPH